MTSAHPGDIHRALAANYRIDREIGGGGMSRVYVATDLALNRQVVVKVLAPELSAGVSAARFRREIQLVASLSHPHIIPLLSAGEAACALYYVMPFMTGEPIRARIMRHPSALRAHRANSTPHGMPWSPNVTPALNTKATEMARAMSVIMPARWSP